MSDEPSQHSDTTTGRAWLPQWVGAEYAANTAHHRVYDDAFLASTPIRSDSRVLDLGCGSGDFTATLAGIAHAGEVVGLDAQPTMLAEARARARPNQAFVLGPVQALADLLPSPSHDATFDLVLSRSVLHWVPAADQPAAYAHAARLLRPGGWVRVECGGAGNVAAVQALLDDVSAALGGPTAPWTFADAATAMRWVEAAGFDHEAGGRGFVRTVAQHRRFDQQTLLGWLRSQVYMAYEAGLPAGARTEFRGAAEARLAELRAPDGSFDQHWVRLDLLAQRPFVRG
jgi:ubiquinone/menaquinone biosynthesis C-methylase UbiE